MSEVQKKAWERTTEWAEGEGVRIPGHINEHGELVANGINTVAMDTGLEVGEAESKSVAKNHKTFPIKIRISEPKDGKRTITILKAGKEIGSKTITAEQTSVKFKLKEEGRERVGELTIDPNIQKAAEIDTMVKLKPPATFAPRQEITPEQRLEKKVSLNEKKLALFNKQLEHYTTRGRGARKSSKK